MTVVPFHDRAAQQAAVLDVVKHLEGGGIIAYPTETVYGFGCAILPMPLAALARVKRRDAARPFLLLVLDQAQTPGLVWTAAARTLAATFWPGPLTLALRAEPGAYPPGIDAGGTVAIRATSHAGIRSILEAFGGPLTSTSANAPGGVPATSAAQATAVLEALGASNAAWVLDGGTLPPSPPSTIVDCARGRPRVLREGAIPTARLRAAVREIDV